MATATADLKEIAADIRDAVRVYVAPNATDADRAEAMGIWAQYNVANQFAARLFAAKLEKLQHQIETVSEMHNSGQYPTAAARRELKKLLAEKVTLISTSQATLF